MKTVEELMASMQSIVDGAKDRELNEEEVRAYEELETELASVRKSDEIRSRQDAYNTPVNTGVRTAVKVDDVDDEMRAFEDYLRTGIPNADLTRAQSEGTPSQGGYLVPEGFRNRIVERMKAFGGLAAAVQEITTTKGDTLPWPTVDDTANTAEIVAEGATMASAGADLVFGTNDLGAYSYMAGGASNAPLKVSWELTQDSEFDITGFVEKALATRLNRSQAPHWVSGTGTGQPLGITYGVTGVQIAANTGVTYSDLVNFVHSIDPAYIANAKWAFNFASLGTLRKMVDTNGRPLWQESTAGMSGSMPGGTLLGFPVVIDQAFPDINLSSGLVNWGVFGDLAESYVIRRVRDVQLITFAERYAEYRQTGYMAWARADATVQNANSYIALTGKA